MVGVALDMDNGKIWFRKGATWQASGDPAGGTNAAFTGISVAQYIGYSTDGSVGTQGTLNAGQSAFANAAPSGFSGWTNP